MRNHQIHKIAYLTFNGALPSRFADAVCVMNMCSCLAAQGAGVELIIPKGQAVSLDELHANGTLWDFYGLPENFSLRYLADPFNRFRPILRKNGYAFLALCCTLLRGAQLVNARHIELAVMAARFGKPFVFECHNFLKPAGSPLFKRFIEIMNVPRCRGAVVTTTQAGRKSFIEAGVPEGRITVLPNGVDVQRYEGLPAGEELRGLLGLPPAGTLACFSGSLYPGRGIENIIYCAEHFPAVFFLVVGGSPEEAARYHAMAQERSIHNMHFTGHVPGTEVPRYLTASDILLMPNTSASSGHSMAYTSSMKTFDYLAAGRPIVASDFPVLREVLVHEQNAYLVPPDSAHELARGLQWVLDNPGAARAMAARARIDAAQYTWQKRAERYLSFVRSTLS